jgi:hypothetical protein
MKRLIWVLAALAALGSAASAQQIVVPAEHRYSSYTGRLPPCDDTGVTSRIHDRFGEKEHEFWDSTLQIVSYDKFREIGFRANGLGYIPRRYCVARALLNDDKEHTVIYQIQEDLGIIGWGYGVEWCVVGLDRNLAYAPACGALRPYLERFLAENPTLRVGY